MLAFDAVIDPGPNPHPDFLGGALHGYFESAILNHAPRLLPSVRPAGVNGLAHFMILPPPFNETPEALLRFGVVLYGQLAKAWPSAFSAIVQQHRSRLNGRRIDFVQADLRQPDGHAHRLMADGRLLHQDVNPSSDEECLRRANEAIEFPASSRCCLSFRSPLLLASHKAQRERLVRTGMLPWPSLGSVLNSVADRIRKLEPCLAEMLAISKDWSATKPMHELEPLTPASRPAFQTIWTYETKDKRIPVPGIVGDLIYGGPLEPPIQRILHWGQWVGVGQKTTMGCGSYVLKFT